MVADTTCDGAAVASLRSDGVGSAIHCDGGQDSRGCWSGLCSFGRRRLSLQLWWRAQQVSAIMLPLFAVWEWDQQGTLVGGTAVEGVVVAYVRLWAWAHRATVVSSTTGEGAVLTSVRLVVVVTESHYGGGHVN